MFQFRQEYLNSSTDCIYKNNYKFYPSNKFCIIYKQQYLPLAIIQNRLI